MKFTEKDIKIGMCLRNNLKTGDEYSSRIISISATDVVEYNLEDKTEKRFPIRWVLDDLNSGESSFDKEQNVQNLLKAIDETSRENTNID